LLSTDGRQRAPRSLPTRRSSDLMEMLGEGETFGVFQLESAGMRRYIQDLKPTTIADICAMVALYRPGPMQHIPRYIQGAHGTIEDRKSTRLNSSHVKISYDAFCL